MMVATLVLCLTILLTPHHSFAQAQQFDRSVTTTTGLTGWWKATPGFIHGPKMYDVTGRTHGTLTNMGTLGTESGWRAPTRPGSKGEVAFDGSDDRVVLPVATYLETPAMTIMLWMKATAFGGDYRALVDYNVGGGTVRELFVTDVGRIAAYFATSGGLISVDTTTQFLNTNQWYHLAVSYSQGDGMRTYINCVQDGSSAAGGTLTVTSGAAGFGYNPNSINRFFQGSMDDIRFYDRVVRPTEVCSIMQSALTGEAQVTPQRTQPLGFLATFIRGMFFPFFRKQ